MLGISTAINFYVLPSLHVFISVELFLSGSILFTCFFKFFVFPSKSGNSLRSGIYRDHNRHGRSSCGQ